MCGINGFNFSDEKLIEQMNSKVKHRGPDADGFFIDQGISLGHTRLSVIDLSKEADQPMLSADQRYVIIYNGELYNYLDIREELEASGFKFKSNSDTEVILNAYVAYKENCLKKFIGIFSFAIWDKKEKKLFAARDHFGVKPFFYYFKNNQLIFSSEIKSILEHDVDKKIDYDSLNLFFRFLYIPGPQTIFKYIQKLQPGHFLIFENNKLKIKKYYSLPTEEKDYSFDEAKELVRTKFDQAVQRQLVSDRPLGMFLSGGIDSTAILGSMSQMVENKIKTFSVKFDIDVEEEKFNSDSHLAKATSRYYKTEHYQTLVKPEQVVDNLEKVVYHMDDLVSNHTQTATYLLAESAKREVDVVLGGDGGDEIFAGYQRYYYYDQIARLQKIPKALRKNVLVKMLAGSLRKNNIYNKLNVNSSFDLFWEFRAQKEKMVNRFLNKEFNQYNKAREIIKQGHFKDDSNDFAKDLMKADLDTWLVDESLIKSDKLTMAWGLEERVPILDKELVELAYSIPMEHKIHSKNQGKYIFKEAIKDYLPDEVYNKPKTGWFSPAAKWLRTGLKDMAYDVLSEDYNADTKELFDFVEIRKILDNHIDKKEYALNTVWSLITFQIWYKLFK
ncbi:asparagine synthase (glutamine-hydrolyzing) [bacterium]|nr:asparagine synthase (glutamine-hydrolyzing) [bacterium]